MSQNDGTTHWEGCEYAHHECALVWLEKDRSLLSQARAWLAGVSGAIADSGLPVPDEAGYGEAVRKIVSERDALREPARAKEIELAAAAIRACCVSEGYAAEGRGTDTHCWACSAALLLERAWSERDALAGRLEKAEARVIELEGALREALDHIGHSHMGCDDCYVVRSSLRRVLAGSESGLAPGTAKEG